MSAAVTPSPPRVEKRDEGAGIDPQRIRGLSPRAIAERFAFGAAVAVAAGIVADTAGERTAGMLLAFPAILPAALTLIERREGTSRAVSDTRGAVAGAIGMVAFALVVIALAGRIGGGAAIGVALVVWLVVAVALYAGAQLLGRVIGEQQYLPDIPVAELEPAAAALRDAHLTLAVAESCTGGSLAALFAALRGASDFLLGGVVAYTDDAKHEELDVPRATLEEAGTVSPETARAMAEGVRRRLGAGVGVAITGLVGEPAEGKPPGLIYVAAVGPRGCHIVEVLDQRGPESGRSSAIRAAVDACQRVCGREPAATA